MTNFTSNPHRFWKSPPTHAQYDAAHREIETSSAASGAGKQRMEAPDAFSLETDADEGFSSAWPWIGVSVFIILAIFGAGFVCGAKWMAL